MPVFPYTELVEVVDGAFSRMGTFAALRPLVSPIRGGLPDSILAEQGLMRPVLTTVLGEGEAWSGAADFAGGAAVGGVWEHARPKRAMTGAELAAELAALKSAKRAQVAAAMASMIAGGFDYEVPGSGVSHSYQVDTSAQANMTAVAADFGLGAVDAHGGFWRSAGNVNVAMSDAECIAFFQAAKAWKQAITRRYWDLLAAVEAVGDWADRGDLDAIDAAAGTIAGAGGWSA